MLSRDFTALVSNISDRKQVIEWTVSLEDCLDHPKGMPIFRAFCEQQFSPEFIHFYERHTIFMNCITQKTRNSIGRDICRDFLRLDYSRGVPPMECNISWNIRQQIKIRLLESNQNFERDLFDGALHEIMDKLQSIW